MTVNELYYNFHLLLNKNAESKNINIAKENFVILYNRESIRWLSDYIDKNIGSDNILNINELIEPKVSLEKIEQNKKSVVYKLPEDYFNLLPGDFISIVKKGDCKSIVYNKIVNPNEVNEILKNKSLAPSFNWERGIAQIYDNKLEVYNSDFIIEDTLISYFKLPDSIDMEGYITFNNEDSKDKNSKNSDYIQHQILDRVVTEVQRQFENKIGFELSKERERKY